MGKRVALGVFVPRINASTVGAMTKVGDALEGERRRREISQEEAGHELGRSQTAFHRYASGDPVPLSIAPAVARFLRKPLPQVRTLILESHEVTEETAERRERPSVGQRLDAIEDSVAALRSELEALANMPRRGGRRTPDGRAPGVH